MHFQFIINSWRLQTSKKKGGSSGRQDELTGSFTGVSQHMCTNLAKTREMGAHTQIYCGIQIKYASYNKLF